MAYATNTELKSRINKIGVADDATLTAILSAAENTINLFCNRPDGFLADAAASARRYAGSGKPYQSIDECIAITLVEVKSSPTDTTYTAWAATDWLGFRGDPEDPNFNGLPYTMLMVDPTGDYAVFYSGSFVTRGGFRPTVEVNRGVPTVRVTARWGYSAAVPADIKEATIMFAARIYKRLEGSMSDALASGELGTLLYRQQLDPDIKQLLVGGRYIKPAVGRR